MATILNKKFFCSLTCVLQTIFTRFLNFFFLFQIIFVKCFKILFLFLLDIIITTILLLLLLLSFQTGVSSISSFHSCSFTFNSHLCFENNNNKNKNINNNNIYH